MAKDQPATRTVTANRTVFIKGVGRKGKGDAPFPVTDGQYRAYKNHLTEVGGRPDHVAADKTRMQTDLTTR